MAIIEVAVNPRPPFQGLLISEISEIVPGAMPDVVLFRQDYPPLSAFLSLF